MIDYGIMSTYRFVLLKNYKISGVSLTSKFLNTIWHVRLKKDKAHTIASCAPHGYWEELYKIKGNK